MKIAPRTVPLLACLIALAACQGEKTAQKGTAEGEILPGSASDAMLPYDTVRSQPPLAPIPVETDQPRTRRGSAGAGIEDPLTESSKATADASAAPTVAAPTATPTSTPTPRPRPEATGQ